MRPSRRRRTQWPCRTACAVHALQGSICRAVASLAVSVKREGSFARTRAVELGGEEGGGSVVGVVGHHHRDGGAPICLQNQYNKRKFLGQRRFERRRTRPTEAYYAVAPPSTPATSPYHGNPYRRPAGEVSRFYYTRYWWLRCARTRWGRVRTAQAVDANAADAAGSRAPNAASVPPTVAVDATAAFLTPCRRLLMVNCRASVGPSRRHPAPASVRCSADKNRRSSSDFMFDARGSPCRPRTAVVSPRACMCVAVA